MLTVTPEYLEAQGLSKNFPERFWKKVDKHGPVPEHRPELGRCWVWTGSRTSEGRYGSVFARYNPAIGRGDYIRAHIASWILHFGAVPDSCCVCHSCDLGICVNPEHLWLGTHTDNMRDMVCKGRDAHCPRELHPNTRLTIEDIANIKREFRDFPELQDRHTAACQSIRRWAKKLGVHKATILRTIFR